jgi:predicted amidohydrolase YtcJ
MSQAADVIVKADQIYSMDGSGRAYRAIAIRGESILAVSIDSDELDGLRDARTRVIDGRTLTVLPADFDTHEHLLEASRNLALVPADEARSLSELADLIRARALLTPPGHWIVTTMSWNETRLAERRLPIAAELDAATTAHPVLCPRGGQSASPTGLRYGSPGSPARRRIRPVARSDVMAMARQRHSRGQRGTGDQGVGTAAPLERQVADLAAASRVYAGLGVGVAREALLEPEQLTVYRRTVEGGELAVRCRPLLNVDPRWPRDRRFAYLDQQASERDRGDDWLQVWGLKLVVDGGVAGAATKQPYADDPGFNGHLNWDRDELTELVAAAVAGGWKVAAHAVGDRAVATVLDAYERVVSSRAPVAPGSLAIEHAMLVEPSDRARAAALGVAIRSSTTSLGAIRSRISSGAPRSTPRDGRSRSRLRRSPFLRPRSTASMGCWRPGRLRVAERFRQPQAREPVRGGRADRLARVPVRSSGDVD